MALHLVLRLLGPFAAFGSVAGEEQRRSGDFPVRSMVLGLIGNALGLDRTRMIDMDRLQLLQDSTWFAALAIDRRQTWRDVQNARAAPADGSALDRPALRARGGRITDDPILYGSRTRRRDKLVEFLGKPVQRTKDYITDAHFLIAISPRGEWVEDPKELAMALRYPARPLWLGRKSCKPSAPIFRLTPLVEAPSGPAALALSLDEEPERAALTLRDAGPLPLLWDGPPEPGDADSQGLGLEGGFPTRVLDRKNWRQQLHGEGSVLRRGTLTVAKPDNDDVT